MVAIECASKKIANKVISTIKVAELPPSLSTKVRGSVRKWRPDRDYGHEKEKTRKHNGQTAAAVMAPAMQTTPPGSGNRQQSGTWQPAKEAKNRMDKMLDNAKSRLRNDSAERTRVEKTMSQMNMTPSEQQSMENRCISTGNGGTVQRWELKGCLEWWHQQEHGGVSEGAGAAVPLPQQIKKKEKKKNTRSLPR
jgi:hypothetical protein